MDSKDWDRISANYYSEVISPLKDADENPLFDDLKKARSKRKTAADIGCGLGPLIPVLSKNFGAVTAVDFSEEMVKNARKRYQKLKNVEYHVADMRNLRRFRDSFDVVVTSNSILAKEVKDVHKILLQLRQTMKKGGRLFAIIPAMEVFLYEAMLIIHREVRRGKSDKEAKRIAMELVTEKEHDFILGKFTFDGDTQKAYYGFEAKHIFKEAGFRNIRIGKVLYSWKEFKDAGQAYFPKEDKPWDWYIVCEK